MPEIPRDFGADISNRVDQIIFSVVFEVFSFKVKLPGKLGVRGLNHVILKRVFKYPHNLMILFSREEGLA